MLWLLISALLSVQAVPIDRTVIYLDYKVDWNNVGNDIKKCVDIGYNVVILSFYMANGPWDAAQTWQSMTEDQRTDAIEYAHQNNASVLVSAGGATFDFASAVNKGVDNAKEFCTKASSWAVKYGLDGVDFDMELPPGDSGPFEDGTAINWLVACSLAAREVLGDKRLISHAPQGPYLGTWAGNARGYVAVYRQAPDAIDFFNIQFYNQGNLYNSYDTLFISNPSMPETSLKEMNQNGIPFEKMVVGKPITTGDASNGYVDPCTLYKWGLRANSEFGWKTGFMGWMYTPGSGSMKKFGSVLSTDFDPNGKLPSGCGGDQSQANRLIGLATELL